MATEANASISLDWLALRPDGHYLGNQCRAWAEALDGFRYAPHRAEDAAAGARQAVAAMREALALPAHDVYVAGPPAFVDAAAAALLDAGAARERLFATAV
jgi:CDP-4-dehydro-6-deoxyglucose reductase